MPLVIGGAVHTPHRENGYNFSGQIPGQESTLPLKNSSQLSCHVHCGEVTGGERRSSVFVIMQPWSQLLIRVGARTIK